MSVIITTNSPLPQGFVGSPYFELVNASSSFTPITFSLIAGVLPAGLSLNSSGYITGTPTTAETVTFTIRATDQAGDTQSKQFQITVNTSTNPNILASTLPNGSIGVAYSQTIQATGGTPPYTNWSVISGSLPNGLSLNSSTGEISGTPTDAGNYSFTIEVTDSNSLTDTQGFAITIPSIAPTITTTFLPNGATDVAYNQTINAANGTTPYVSWIISGGSLPPGLTLSSSPTSGTISGIPTTNGNYTFTVQVTDSAGGTANEEYTVTIFSSALPNFSVNTFPSGVVGIAYTATASVVGGQTPYAWSRVAGVLPTGLTLDAATGEISGTPTDDGTYTFTLKAVDNNGAYVTKQFFILIGSTETPIITTRAFADSVLGDSYSQFTQAINGCQPYSWSVSSGALPDGLTLNSNTGLVSGISTNSGIFNFDITVEDCNNDTDTLSYSIEIYATPTLFITTPFLNDGQFGIGYSEQFKAKYGTTPYSWAITSGALPDGLTLNSINGKLTGVPNETGDFTFTVEVTDDDSNTATRQFSFSIDTSEVISGCCFCAYTNEVILFNNNANGNGVLTSTGGTVLTNNSWQAPPEEGYYSVILTVDTAFGPTRAVNTITVVKRLEFIGYTLLGE